MADEIRVVRREPETFEVREWNDPVFPERHIDVPLALNPDHGTGLWTEAEFHATFQTVDEAEATAWNRVLNELIADAKAKLAETEPPTGEPIPFWEDERDEAANLINCLIPHLKPDGASHD